MELKYRPEVDGLRAVAVMCVVFFHVGFAWMPGGFVGVDVFFVISGYLITRMIMTDIAAGSFSYATFYGRRVRRLGPAFIATVVFTLAASAVLFTPQDLTRLGKEAMSVVIGIANFYYWLHSGYFEAGASVRPLLHTWSLAVEEQYYLFWPALLVLSSKRLGPRTFFVFLAVAALASLLSSEYYVEKHRDMVFFLTPFRIWEFFVGGLIYWCPNWSIRNKLGGDALTAGGLALIVYSAATLRSTQVFPGFAALLPCIGAMFVIMANRTQFTTLLLRNPLAVGIGRISYSLYLIHWPVIVLFTYYKFNFHPALSDQTLMIALALALATGMYFFIEMPFRHRRGNTKEISASAFGLVCAVATIGIMFTSSDMWATLGWQWRVPNAMPPAIAGYGACAVNDHCVVGAKSGTMVLVVGDSHARHLVAGLDKFGKANGIVFSVHTAPSCLITPYGLGLNTAFQEQCKKMEQSFSVELAKSENVAIVMAQRWRGYGDFQKVQDEVTEFIKNNSGHPILLVGQVPQPMRPVSLCGQLPAYVFDHKLCSVFERDVMAKNIAGRLTIVAANAPNAAFANPSDGICNSIGCEATEGGVSNYSDGHHLSVTGSTRVVSSVIGPSLLKLLHRESVAGAQ
jgi:peptidoglycan/LPS O-acetylase OafA/YrhL